LYTVAEAAKLLGITPTRLHQLRSEYGFGTEKFGMNIIITHEDLELLRQRPTRRGRKSRRYKRAGED